MKKLLALLVSCLLPLGASAAPHTFSLKNINIGNGWLIAGTVTTDGSTGALNASNIISWNLTTSQTTDAVFTEKNTSAANISSISTSADGRSLIVPTTINLTDGSQLDGGFLGFLSGAAYGGIPSGPIVADFTLNGLNVIGSPGGYAGWQSPLALNFVPLNLRDNINYVAGKSSFWRPRTFKITPVTISDAPTLITMFGTITTDGTRGALSPSNFVSWRIVGREQDIQQYNESNSQILSATNISTDNVTLKVASSGGALQFGIRSVQPSAQPIIVTIADFTDSNYPHGIASYYYGYQGLVGSKFPLASTKKYIVGFAK